MSDREKAIFYNDKAETTHDLDSMLYYNSYAIDYSNKCACDSLKISSNFFRAYFQYHSGLYTEALSQLKKLDSINSPIVSNFYHSKMLNLYSDVYTYTNRQSEALDYSEKALEFAKKQGDSIEIADAYMGLGAIYLTNRLFDEAKTYYLKALGTYQNNNASYKKLFPIYCGLRETASSLEEFEAYDNKSFEIIQEEDANSMSYLYVTGSTFLLNNGLSLPKAKRYALKGLKISDSINYLPLKKIALYNLGFIENELGNFQNAIPYFEASINTVETNSNSYFLLLNGLAKAHAGKGDFANAYSYTKKAILTKDTIFENRSTEEFAEFDIKYKTAEKDKEIAQQQLEIAKEKSARNNWIFGSIAAMLIVLGAFQWISFRQKRKKIAIETELAKEQEINDLRTKFLGNIAHEIRTPLTLISGNLDLALDNLNQKEKAKENIIVALENSKKVTEDANEILELLKFEKNKTTLKLVPTNLDEALKRMVFSFKSLTEMKSLTLIYKSSIPKDFITKVDLEKTEKIMNNLISNAIKYSPSKKDILINSSVSKNLLSLTVTDFGEGIQYDETEKIFERFYQSTHNKSIGGIGIGLSLSREFAELLGGTLTVESNYGEGSTFLLQLPATTINSSVPSFEETPAVPTPQEVEEDILKHSGSIHQKSRILIVEDNPQMATYLKDILSKNYHCTLAFDGEEALNKIRTEPFDLITSDIMMPKLDGFQLRERLNELEQFANIPFILISAKTLEEDKIRGFKLGIDDYVVKPFNKNELIARVNNLLSNKVAREQWNIDNKSLVADTEASDKKLLKAIENNVITNLSNESFKVNELANSVNYSQRQLTRIIKQHTGMTPVKFILEIRLQKAYQLLQHNTFFTLSEVRYDVGISSSSYFNKKFKERFGLNPSELLS